jgi:hypothetical protein
MRFANLAAAALALVGSLVTASAQDTYNNTGTCAIDVAHSVFGDAFAGSDSFASSDSDFSPTRNLGNLSTLPVNLVMDSLIGAFLLTFNSSYVNVSGGTVGQESGVNVSNPSTGSFTLIGQNPVATSVGTDLTFNGRRLRGYVINAGDGSTLTPQNAAAVPELSTFLGFGSLVALGGLAMLRQSKNARKDA